VNYQSARRQINENITLEIDYRFINSSERLIAVFDHNAETLEVLVLGINKKTCVINVYGSVHRESMSLFVGPCIVNLCLCSWVSSS
jgi:hypothetical protein